MHAATHTIVRVRKAASIKQPPFRSVMNVELYPLTIISSAFVLVHVSYVLVLALLHTRVEVLHASVPATFHE